MVPEPLTTVGSATSRIDGLERVTGRAQYTGDVQLSGMLYARVLRSPYAHAQIRRIDDSAARAMPGVHAVVTRDNCDVVWSSGDWHGQRYLFNNPVRFVGDPVAAVAAVDRHTAEEALEKIEVEYAPLGFVLDQEAALKSDAVEIHPGGNLSPQRNGERQAEVYERGNVEDGLAASDLIIEDTYTSKHHNNAQMEPRV